MNDVRIYNASPRLLRKAKRVLESGTPNRTTIASRGADATNFLGLPCKTCHADAAKFDFVCEKTHGCLPLPIRDEDIDRAQRTDPRCPPQ